MAERRVEGTPQPHRGITRNVGQMPTKTSPDFVRVYANIVGVATSPWDISFMFAQPITDSPDEIYLEQRASVTMSFEAAKSLVDLLSNTIQNYEKQLDESKASPHPAQNKRPRG